MGLHFPFTNIVFYVSTICAFTQCVLIASKIASKLASRAQSGAVPRQVAAFNEKAKSVVTATTATATTSAAVERDEAAADAPSNATSIGSHRTRHTSRGGFTGAPKPRPIIAQNVDSEDEFETAADDDDDPDDDDCDKKGGVEVPKPRKGRRKQGDRCVLVAATTLS